MKIGRRGFFGLLGGAAAAGPVAAAAPARFTVSNAGVITTGLIADGVITNFKIAWPHNPQSANYEMSAKAVTELIAKNAALRRGYY